MRCPHEGCSGKIEVDLIVRHAESYGGSRSLVLCPKCNKGVTIHSSVKINLTAEPYKGPKTYATWGGDIPASA